MSPSSTSPSTKWTTGTVVGALAAAFMASICCIGPVVFALLGLGGAGLLVKFEHYRPYFVVATLALLSVGFFFTYRKPKVVEGDACGCEHPKTNRLGRIMLWVATVVVAGFLAFPSIAAHAWSASPSPVSQNAITTTRIEIEGMDCAACTAAIRIALLKLDGVKEVTVSFSEKAATISYDSSKVNAQRLVEAVDALGYKARISTRKS